MKTFMPQVPCIGEEFGCRQELEAAPEDLGVPDSMRFGEGRSKKFARLGLV
jgi:hypothetical protein